MTDSELPATTRPEIPASPRTGGDPAPGSFTVVNGLVVINAAVFLLWIWAGMPIEIMAENFLVSGKHLAEGRIWVLVSSVFSHNLLIHLGINMIVLLSFGPPLEQLMGGLRFLAFFLLAGVTGSLAHVATSRFLLDQPGLPALGASGAIAGLLMLFSFSFPRARVLLFFLIPVPALFAALAFVGIDLWGLFAQIEGEGLPIGHGAHLGGALVGIVYTLFKGRELRARRRDSGPTA